MKNEIHVVSVNISKEKGTIKVPVGKIEVDGFGVQDDAHAGLWHRQVSLLAKESIEKFEKTLGRKVAYGEFAENITTSGMLLYQAKPLDQFKIGTVILEVTQIGKECHGTSCAIFNEVGKCIMPAEGIFARVIRPGKIKDCDLIKYHPKKFMVGIITLSDRAYSGEYPDRSGPEIEKHLREYFEENKLGYEFDRVIIPDEPKPLRWAIENAAEHNFDIFITTGGTGIGPRDYTVDVIKEMLDKEIPGIMEMIRVKYGVEKPNALLSRGVAGVLGNTLIYTLPGSVKAVREYMEEILKTLNHAILMIHRIDAH